MFPPWFVLELVENTTLLTLRYHVSSFPVLVEDIFTWRRSIRAFRWKQPT